MIYGKKMSKILLKTALVAPKDAVLSKKKYLAPLLRVGADKKSTKLSFGRRGMGGCG